MTHLPDTMRHLVNLFNDAKYGEPPLNGIAPGTGRKRLTCYKTSQGNWICHPSAVVFVQSLNHVWPFVTPWTTACQASLSFTIFQSLLKLMSIEFGDAIQSSHPLSPPSPPALNLSQHQRLFKSVSSSHQVAKVLEYQLQCQSFQWTPRTDLL